MGIGQRPSGRRFFVKQAVLLALTLILMAFFTIPLIQAVRWAFNPGALQEVVDGANNTLASVRTQLDVTRSKMLMGASDDETQEKMKKRTEELEHRLVLKELENKYLQSQVALSQTFAQLAALKSAGTPAPTVDTGPKEQRPAEKSQNVESLADKTLEKVDKLVGTGSKVMELIIKLFGSIGSAITGVAFVVSWLRKRRQPTGAPTS